MKPFQAKTSGLGLAEKETPEEQTKVLQAAIERGIVLQNMTGTPGWKAFEEVLATRFAGVQQALEEEKDLRQVPRLQEQLKELRFVLGWVYSEINAAEGAKLAVQQADTGDE